MINTGINNSSKGIILFGFGEVAKGFCDVADGEIKKGTLTIISGLNKVNTGSAINYYPAHSIIMHNALKIGAYAVVTQGAIRSIQGIKKRELKTTICGTLQTATGCMTVIYLNCVDSKTIAIAHRALTFSFLSGQLSWTGIKNFIKGEYKNGFLQMFAGAMGILSSGCYAYHELTAEAQVSKEVPPHIESFLQAHETEIREIYIKKESKGNWTELGEGVSKKAYSHSNFDFIIKIPTRTFSYWGHEDSDIIVHYNQIQVANDIINKNGLDKLITPEAYLIQYPEGPFVVEKKLETIDFNQVNKSSEKDVAIEQLHDFLNKGSYCDINIKRNHNAGILLNTEENPMIGVFDLDCNNTLKSNFLNLQKISIESFSIFASAKQSFENLENKYIKLPSNSGYTAGIATLIYTRPSWSFPLTLIGSTVSCIIEGVNETVNLIEKEIKTRPVYQTAAGMIAYTSLLYQAPLETLFISSASMAFIGIGSFSLKAAPFLTFFDPIHEHGQNTRI